MNLNLDQLDSQKDEFLIYVAGKENNREAFEILMKRYYKKIFNYLNKILKDENEVEDIVQETFLKVYLNKKRFIPFNSFSSWLYRIATNQALKKIRKNKIQNLFMFKFIEKLKLSNYNQNSILNPYEYIHILKPKEKISIILTKYYGFSYEETSRMINASVGATKTYVFRGMEKLKKIIKQEEEKWKTKG
ncbi:MAG: RNA polymerase sigma factor [Acidobacteriota bacterium]